MRKWRPTHKCIYIIPEVHGSIESLKIIFSRIFPLRFSINQEDIVIMLGDYIDKGDDSAGVLELILEAKREYKDKLICLRGNHEQLFLDSFKSNDIYQSWLIRGGIATIQSYLDRKNFQAIPHTIPLSRLPDIIPSDHIDFLNSLPSHIVLEDYVLFHGGIDLENPLQTNATVYISDVKASQTIKKLIKDKQYPLMTSDKIYVGAHNFKNKTPFIYPKYFMLGGSAPKNLILFELNSMTCAMIKSGKSRIYKHNFKYFE